MAAAAARRRPHLASSPFKPQPEPIIEVFVTDERVSHDSFGLGRVVSVDAGGVTVDFGDQTLRIPTPFAHLHKL